MHTTSCQSSCFHSRKAQIDLLRLTDANVCKCIHTVFADECIYQRVRDQASVSRMSVTWLKSCELERCFVKRKAVRREDETSFAPMCRCQPNHGTRETVRVCACLFVFAYVLHMMSWVMSRLTPVRSLLTPVNRQRTWSFPNADSHRSTWVFHMRGWSSTLNTWWCPHLGTQCHGSMYAKQLLPNKCVHDDC